MTRADNAITGAKLRIRCFSFQHEPASGETVLAEGRNYG
jgi:hypothetical protein